MKILKLLFIGMLVFSSATLFAGIKNTKHNLSVTNTVGNVKATSETEICVFCHTPHGAEALGKPIWNRSMPTSNYTMYDSDYLQRMNYPAVLTDLGTANNTPGALSRQCLSCHDGTVAIGSITNAPGSGLGNDIAMTGVQGDGTMPTGVTRFGTDLGVHHPVGREYNPDVNLNFGSGVRPMELRPIAEMNTKPATSKVRLFDYGGTKYIECSSCHNPHKENFKFLHVDTEPTAGQNAVATCTSCHDKVDWTGSVHQTQTVTYTDPAVSARYETGKVGELGCLNCHMPHNAGGGANSYINRKFQANTCFQGASTTGVAGANCHGSGGAKDIFVALNKTYAHPVLANSDEVALGGIPKHTNLDVLFGKPNSDPKGLDWSTPKGKHAMCMDCHNPHKAKKGTHAGDSSMYGTTATSSRNLVSNAIRGVPGVEPTWPSRWLQPQTFTTLESATKEYQICLKCHSYWGLGDAVGGVNIGGHNSVSDVSVPMTDVAWEFNVNNRSGHPVVLEANGRPGSYSPRALTSYQMKSPFDSNLGTQTMYCSDCHGADQELAGDPRGPHGSNRKFMLKGSNPYWPAKSDGDLYTISTSNDGGLFCLNCHDLSVRSVHQGTWGPFGMVGAACVTCHVAIPHGSPISRLIGYQGFPAPYNYNGNTLAPLGFKKSNPNDSYSMSNLYSDWRSTVNGRSISCSFPHGFFNSGGYDTAPSGW